MSILEARGHATHTEQSETFQPATHSWPSNTGGSSSGHIDVKTASDRPAPAIPNSGCLVRFVAMIKTLCRRRSQKHPKIKLYHVCQPCLPATGHRFGEQRNTPVALDVEGVGNPAGEVVRLQHRNGVPVPGEHRRGRQSTHARTDHDDVGFVGSGTGRDGN